MPRPKSVSDTQVQTAIASLYARGGDKAVTFATVAVATGLAPPTLVQRYRSRDAMLEWALLCSWDTVDAATEAALPTLVDRGEAAFLKAIAQSVAASVHFASLVTAKHSKALDARAVAWRATIETHLARSFGTGRQAETLATIAFATWQGQLLWDAAGGRGFRLKDALRRLR
jgi:AcrR family transcriptional regulator